MNEHVNVAEREDALVQLGLCLRQQGYQFTTTTPATHERVLARDKGDTSVGGVRLALDLRDVFGWSRPFARSLLSPQLFGLLERTGQLRNVGAYYQSGLRFSSLGDLLLAHSAYPTAAADSIFFGPDTYRFCDLLTRWASKADAVVDIGCGSGAGGLWLAHMQARREVILTDINPHALSVARANAALAGIEVRTLESDLFAALPELPPLCIANPPYMRDAQHRAYRDGGGLHGEGLSIRIAKEWLARALPGQTLILYTGSAIVEGRDPIRGQIAAMAAAHGAEFDGLELDPDVFGEELSLSNYADVDRIAAVGIRLTR
jgi:hypothetical protein